ncbi:MAG: helix-hairpin-helix domain-containing protein [Actinomycetota bacterium]|nr:helix-hairpin-helix domain-containing protein [Actinomycetota bacterium]
MREILIERGWRERVQELAARRKDSWPLLALAGAAVVVTLVLVGRPAPAQIAPPSQLAAPSQPPPAAVASVSSSGPTVLVHVAGAVRKPGLYEFPPGARIADAIETAGGPTARADLDALNLAELLVDGTKVEVVRVGESPTVAPGAVGPTTGAQPGALIPLNSADQAMLETIPGVGPVTAMAILSYREQIASFSSLEQLLEVDGIGPATFDSIRTYVTL